MIERVAVPGEYFERSPHLDSGRSHNLIKIVGLDSAGTGCEQEGSTRLQQRKYLSHQLDISLKGPFFLLLPFGKRGRIDDD